MKELLIILTVLVIPQLVMAQSWGYPHGYPWKRSPLIVVAPELIAPVNNQVVDGPRNQDLNQMFGWDSGVHRRQSFIERFRRLPSGLGLAPAIPQRQFTLCIYDNARCDRSGTGVQQESSSSSRFSTTWFVAPVPYQQLQGKAFQWAVRECVYVRIHPEVVAWQQRCAWSPSYNLVWRLPAPDQLFVDLEERYQWHLAFHWSRVTHSDYYLICMSVSPASLNNCVLNTNPQPGVSKESESGTTYRRFGSPPIHTGNPGDDFFWKVAACSLDPALPTQFACSDWSATSQNTWPAQ